MASTPNLMMEIRNQIEQKQDIHIRTELKFVTEERDPVSESVSFVKIEDRNKNPFLSLLTSGCLKNDTSTIGSNHSGTEFYLRGMQSLVLLKKKQVQVVPADERLEIRFALGMKCSQGTPFSYLDHRDYTFFSVGDTQDVSFAVIMKPKSELRFSSALSSLKILTLLSVENSLTPS